MDAATPLTRRRMLGTTALAVTGVLVHPQLRPLKAEKTLELADRSTKIIPGHGALSDREALTRYRDMLVTVHDRVRKVKASGRSREQVLAEKPTGDLDATWSKDFLSGEMFVALAYETL